LAEAQKYALDPSHSQIVFSYDHAGFSRTTGVFSGFDGEIQFDQQDPAASSVLVSFPVDTMFTGWEARAAHFLQSGDFFNLAEHPTITFESTDIDVTGDTTALITGNLTMNGVTRPVVLDSAMVKAGEYPFPPFQGKAAAGFVASTTVLRSDFNLGLFAPFVSDAVKIDLSIEAMAAD